MANILEKYGIKEVADVTFYDIDDGYPVLYLDTLKVSTIEQTAENTSARGGKGNPELIIWDYNKEITVTLEDALYSAKSMAVMFGSQVDNSVSAASITRVYHFHGSTIPTQIMIAGALVTVSALNIYTGVGSSTIASNALSSDGDYMMTYEVAAKDIRKITINADTFPGTYKVVGDTYARSERTGTDELFQFVINKAKVLSEVTLTMEAEGDPSTFNMDLKVLRPDDGKMIELIQYSL